MAFTAEDLVKELKKYASKEREEISLRFFKTQKGEYGEGDQFIGVRVPDTRKVTKQFLDLNFTEIRKLLYSPLHEVRLAALLLLVALYEGGDEAKKEKVLQFYLKHKSKVNNWDLVDISADKIVGAYFHKKDSSLLFELAESKVLWDRRIAIVSTYYSIYRKEFKVALKLSKMLLGDKEDLMHKAVGWMLREIGKRDKAVLDQFLEKNLTKMPRTALRYAIERHPEKERKAYLKREK